MLDISSLVPCVDQLQKTCATLAVDLLFKECFCCNHMCFWELKLWEIYSNIHNTYMGD